MLRSLENAGITYEIATFDGECAYEEIELHTGALRNAAIEADCVIALGGGKVVDTGKCIAHRLGVPTIVIPSLASNDAPCSAASVIYTPEGVTTGFEVFAENPALVLVDTQVIAAAPARYLVAGMGDAMATWYEARACSLNPLALTPFGARPTLAGTAIAELCARTVYACGEEALEAVSEGAISDSLERLVEANTLLSGVGFECGGLAASHGFAQAYTVVPHIHANLLHGEMVAMGVLAQLALEAWDEEAEKATRFFTRVGLPVTLRQLGVAREDRATLDAVVGAAHAMFFTAHMHVDTAPERLLAAILEADQRGQDVIEELGDEAFNALHRPS